MTMRRLLRVTVVEAPDAARDAYRAQHDAFRDAVMSCGRRAWLFHQPGTGRWLEFLEGMAGAAAERLVLGPAERAAEASLRSAGAVVREEWWTDASAETHCNRGERTCNGP